MFSIRLNVGSRLKNWKTNPSRSRRTDVKPSSGSVSRRDPIEDDAARAGPLHRATEVQESGFSAARGADNRHELAMRDLEADVAHGRHRGIAAW